jgi:hypothetical protein
LDSRKDSPDAETRRVSLLMVQLVTTKSLDQTTIVPFI